MSYRADKQVIDTQTDGHTDAGNDNTRRPKLASGKTSIVWLSINMIYLIKILWITKFQWGFDFKVEFSPGGVSLFHCDIEIVLILFCNTWPCQKLQHILFDMT